jgi:L-ascorbate metabolism protein UlaG (beta-lactamase superfamily)
MKFLVTILLLLSSCNTFNKDPKPYYKGAISDHFDGIRFKSEHKENYLNTIRFFFTIKDGWGRNHEEINPVILNNFKEINKARVTFIGHATLLIQLADLNILTDPIWSDRAGPIPFMGFSVKRQNPPAVEIEDLPKIDYVLISYNSYHHMDIPTIKKLQEKFRPVFVTGLGNCYYLKEIKKLDLQCIELDWDQKVKVKNGTDFYFVKSKNFSKRTWFDKNKTLWGSFAIMSPEFKIFFASDGGYSQNLLRDINAKFGQFDLALIPIGSYEPRWMMRDNHITPQEAVKTHILLNAKKSIGTHFNTFQTTTEGYFDAQIELEEAKKLYGLSGSDFVAPKFGEVFEF